MNLFHSSGYLYTFCVQSSQDFEKNIFLNFHIGYFDQIELGLNFICMHIGDFWTSHILETVKATTSLLEHFLQEFSKEPNQTLHTNKT